jgi:beta-lactamase class A
MHKRTIWYVIGIIVGLNVLGWVLFTASHSTQKNSNVRANYPLLSARIFADNPNDILINFVPLRKQLETKFAALPAGTKYSFYFEYLPSGTSIRIGEDNVLVAASLIKVPLVMNLYRAAEMGKINLDQVVTIQESELDNAYGDLWQKGAGTQLTLRQLAQLTLEKSDNTASRVIYDHVKGLLDEEDQSLAQLDVDQSLENGQAVIDAISYTSVLKSLYFSSYVNRDHSQELLGYLAQSVEHNRLTKNLPSNVTVAHKNGVYNQNWSESDCGLVYVPKRPYAICVMVGLPETEADTFIANTSKTIYDYVTQAKTDRH